jgi:hypothetical protein
VPEGERSHGISLTIRHRAEEEPIVPQKATAEERPPRGLKLRDVGMVVPSTDIFPKVNQITY